ncbi:hypothetical protein IMZ31_21540 (plasmid) [Pontibacillus sp. ALD_SL1]|uniref:hypothetical protein n=1 Tax=Pontibacillus sp. ALD_SL1 TaxID=2777185 RepID=UPI001A956A26|nr:hypothetical protein [Pontibacillus sp. ALD_SL1]QST02036.1 hypothetical protein IMZ31_21540 [Pontibacillus sp. ALD_SL1]
MKEIRHVKKTINGTTEEYTIYFEESVPFTLRQLGLQENEVTGPLISLYAKLSDGEHMVYHEDKNTVLKIKRKKDSILLESIKKLTASIDPYMKVTIYSKND